MHAWKAEGRLQGVWGFSNLFTQLAGFGLSARSAGAQEFANTGGGSVGARTVVQVYACMDTFQSITARSAVSAAHTDAHHCKVCSILLPCGSALMDDRKARVGTAAAQ